jgi:hypothetical protein
VEVSEQNVGSHLYLGNGIHVCKMSLFCGLANLPKAKICHIRIRLTFIPCFLA